MNHIQYPLPLGFHREIIYPLCHSIFFINDLSDMINNSTILLFADDAKLIKIINNQNDLNSLNNT